MIQRPPVIFASSVRPWLAVGLPMACDFNETVAMDLVNTGNKI